MQIIIPRQTFENPFQDILNGIHGVITRSERKLLALFERHCYQDGQIYPKQKTIAWKLGLTVRQVRRLIASLVKKGFLKVVSPSLIDRHVYGKGNQYHLVDHPAYHQDQGKISSEMSSETEDHTINKNKVIKTKSGFNIVEWLERNQHKHGQAIVDALNALTARWPSIRLPGQYAQKIVDVQSGNYAEQDHQAQVDQEKTEFNAGYAVIAEMLGVDLGMDKTGPEDKPAAEPRYDFSKMSEESLKQLADAGNVLALEELKRRK